MSGVRWGYATERWPSAVICGQGPSWAEVQREHLVAAREKGAAIVAVNGAIESFGGAPFTHWFTLDLSAENLARAASPVAGVRYYAAVPDDYAKRFPIFDHVTYLRRIVREEPKTGPFHVRVLRQIVGGLAEDRSEIYTGNSAFGALGLVYHFGVRRVVLLGVDGKGTKRWDGTPNGDLRHMERLFAGAVRQLLRNGVTVANGSRDSEVDAWPRSTPQAALATL